MWSVWRFLDRLTLCAIDMLIMNQTTFKLLLLLIVCLPISLTQAQTQKGELVIGKSFTSEITPTEKHKYNIVLEKDQIAFFKLMQNGVDMVITTYDSEGKKIEVIDGPTGAYGPEKFSIISNEKGGKYMIEVYPYDHKEPSGNYELTVESSKAVSQSDYVHKILSPWDNNEIPGLAVAIVKDGATVYSKGYGMANLEHDIPINSSTAFDVGSLSKQFTAYTISYLVEEGKISLEDDIRDYIPEFPDFGHTITIDHLVHSTSGLRDWPGTLSMKMKVFGNIITFDDIISMVYNQKELNFTPGSEHLYSSTGYCVLAELVQRVSGVSFRQWTETNIFQPLGMQNTHFHDDHTEIVKNKANGYFADQNGYHLSSNNLAVVGSSSLYTTIDDLAKWANNILHPKAENETIIKRMFQQGLLNDGTEIPYAFGLYVGTQDGLKKISHTGSWASFKSYSGYYPDEDFSVIILSNSASSHPEVIADEIAKVYLNDQFLESSKATGNTERKEELTQIQVSGNYELPFTGMFEVNAENDSLHVIQSWNNINYTMINTMGNTYGIPNYPPLQFVFSELKDDFAQTLTIIENGIETSCKRIEKIDFSVFDLDDYTGEYYSEELSTTYNFVIVENKLFTKHSTISGFNLNPLKTDIFNGEAWFFGEVEFIRGSNNAVTGFKVSNEHVRNIYFEKIN